MPKDFGEGDVFKDEVPFYLKKLIDFIGQADVERNIKNYKKALMIARPVYKRYYLEELQFNRAMLEYHELSKKGKSIHKHLSDDLVSIAKDALKIYKLNRFMPQEIRASYKSSLSSIGDYNSCLHEINTAWHFYLKGFKISWHTKKGKKAEFTITNDKEKYDIECKTISISNYRKIKPTDFFRLCDLLFPQLIKRKLMGEIRIEINDGLPSDNKKLLRLSKEILSYLSESDYFITSRLSNATLINKVSIFNDEALDPDLLHKDLKEQLPPNYYGIILFCSKNAIFCNPLKIICSSQPWTSIIPKIAKIAHDSAIKQLDKDVPGMLDIYLQGLDDIEKFRDTPELHSILSTVFNSQNTTHVCRVVFRSDTRVRDFQTYKIFDAKVLSNLNPYCKFTVPEKFPYIN